MRHQRNINIRIITALALCALALVVALSLAAVVVHAGHHCPGVQCAACLHISQATATLRALVATGIFMLLDALCSARPCIFSVSCGSVLWAQRTPVALRTRMDN